MKKSWIIVLMTLAACGSPAEDFSSVLRKESVPFDQNSATRRSLVTVDGGGVELVIDPLQHNRQFDAGMESTEQYFHIATDYELNQAWSLGCETGGGVQRVDSFAPFADQPALQQNVSLFQRAWLKWKLAKAFAVTGRAQSGVNGRDNADGFVQTTRYNTDVSFTPREGTVLHTDVARQETYGLDQSIVFQDIYSAALDQKLAWVPVTIHSTWNYGREDAAGSRVPANETARMALSAVWKVEERLALSAGYESRMTDTENDLRDQEFQSYFGQLQLQPAQALTLNVRTASESVTNQQGTPDEMTHRRVSLTLGANVQFAQTLSAGFSVKYPLITSDPAPVAPTPYFSISANAAF